MKHFLECVKNELIRYLKLCIANLQIGFAFSNFLIVLTISTKEKKKKEKKKGKEEKEKREMLWKIVNLTKMFKCQRLTLCTKLKHLLENAKIDYQ